MKLHVTRPCRKLRGSAYFHAIADAAGCNHTPDGINRYWRSLKPRLSLNRSRWQRSKHGAQLSTGTRRELASYHPHLDVMFNNPIWSVLNNTLNPEDWNALADTIQVNGRPLREWQTMKPGRLFQRIDWSCICVYLVLWRTTSEGYSLYRRWVEVNFPDIFLLLTLQLPMTHIRQELYDLLTGEVKQRVQGPLVRQLWFDWPDRYFAYEECCELLDSFKWLKGRRDLCTLLLWRFVPELKALLIDGEEITELSSTSQRYCPLRRRFHRTVRRCQNTSITLNGICCTLDWPSQAIGLETLEQGGTCDSH